MKLKLQFNGRHERMRYRLKMGLEPSPLSVWREVVLQAESALQSEFATAGLTSITITVVKPRKGRKG